MQILQLPALGLNFGQTIQSSEIKCREMRYYQDLFINVDIFTKTGVFIGIMKVVMWQASRLLGSIVDIRNKMALCTELSNSCLV